MSKDKQAAALTKRQTLMQAVKFTAFSCMAGTIQVVSFTLMNEFTNFPYWPSYLIALILSVLFNFTVNRRFTFKSANNVPLAMMKVLGFYAVFTPASTWLGNVAEKSGINEYIVLAVTMLANFVLEYLFCRFVVYRGSMNTNELAQKSGTASK